MGHLPADFPPYRRVHAFARRWQVTGLLAELHDRLRDCVRDKEGRLPDPTAAIVDSQSVRAAVNIPRSTSAWDGGKKVAGRKRHLVVDCFGLGLAVAVTAASVQDRDAAVPLLQRLRRQYFSIRLLWADGDYARRLVDWAREKPRKSSVQVWQSLRPQPTWLGPDWGRGDRVGVDSCVAGRCPADSTKYPKRK